MPFTLKARKGLITDGLFARTRNPNYLGEILIYFAYAMLSLHWLPFAIEAAWILGFFWPNMRKKDASMARYPEFAAYNAKGHAAATHLRTRATSRRGCAAVGAPARAGSRCELGST